ncbi:hypothetical protein RFI_22276 [Reticulomyxa filosa]|uniref:Ribosomal RNA-processing protein 14/surfeit locus protein 6 C-terminal domain-containing protein n=1 Tax=Reticulomyxa filosa TaxID=46433 RepID=X6MM44_RETFI|nr:hypothetical protein RFI_22276 [Reticulomyxa filosa]|eukprot:ETO15088.1 hypothetical protein RFI_22276 [Reticulomyxa filosa]
MCDVNDKKKFKNCYVIQMLYWICHGIYHQEEFKLNFDDVDCNSADLFSRLLNINILVRRLYSVCVIFGDDKIGTSKQNKTKKKAYYDFFSIYLLLVLTFHFFNFFLRSPVLKKILVLLQRLADEKVEDNLYVLQKRLKKNIMKKRRSKRRWKAIEAKKSFGFNKKQERRTMNIQKRIHSVKERRTGKLLPTEKLVELADV